MSGMTERRQFGANTKECQFIKREIIEKFHGHDLSASAQTCRRRIARSSFDRRRRPEAVHPTLRLGGRALFASELIPRLPNPRSSRATLSASVTAITACDGKTQALMSAMGGKRTLAPGAVSGPVAGLEPASLRAGTRCV